MNVHLSPYFNLKWNIKSTTSKLKVFKAESLLIFDWVHCTWWFCAQRSRHNYVTLCCRQCELCHRPAQSLIWICHRGRSSPWSLAHFMLEAKQIDVQLIDILLRRVGFDEGGQFVVWCIISNTNAFSAAQPVDAPHPWRLSAGVPWGPWHNLP